MTVNKFDSRPTSPSATSVDTKLQSNVDDSLNKGFTEKPVVVQDLTELSDFEEDDEDEDEDDEDEDEDDDLQLNNKSHKSKGVKFAKDDEEDEQSVTVDNTANSKPNRSKSFLNNDGIDELKPITRKHRVSSISLTDQLSNSLIKPLTSTTTNTNSMISHERVASYAFAFDIDGVLIRGKETIPEARKALKMLNGENKYNIKVPYIFITNGGGRSEKARCKDLSSRLGISISEDQVIQGHTPMKDLVPVYKNVLVVGGVLDSCRKVALNYGFENVYIPLDIMKWNPCVTPYYILSDEERKIAYDNVDFSKIHIDAILVFADSRNWAADQQIILELLLSKNGVMGTISDTFDEGPALYFAHSDFVWATDYGLSRYGMGALQVSIAALYQEHSGKELNVTRFGKPQRGTFRFAEKVLTKWRRNTLESEFDKLKLTSTEQPPLKEDEGEEEVEEEITNETDSLDDDEDDEGIVLDSAKELTLDLPPASTVYFVGDTPESDIRFANSHDSSWYSILVKTGVYQDGSIPKYKPKKICENVLEAVTFAIEREHAKELEEWKDNNSSRSSSNSTTNTNKHFTS
ncbi:uncharacterized protein SCODWIG_02946 [Saccharomycodes ludwigii]|uniref:Uncharacterized protein n=1 Tax=Saccharomycodes ludwigii TaxID=36035 RepID=A0A376B942_9ASCO|nr:hypothetical protein SCDLUD_001896 [Saccharomycodes ludwigii]KAH3902083.1 hypothetical protein SCDLUD_001896 [Saccharomycodes ludwigii]SSD61185.1 uncharacterized protein SCODWIG_02946 [Saccharomycodes ludwigii]